jgi:DNA polymerase II large subunit
LALKEYDLWELVDKVVTPPTDPTTLEAQNKKEIKVERVLLDFMKDHLIPYLTEKNMAKEMFDALVSLFQSKNMNIQMVLRNKIRSMQMSQVMETILQRHLCSRKYTILEDTLG